MGGNDPEQVDLNAKRPFFVYGTLLPGQPNDRHWLDLSPQLETAVLHNGRLYDMGHYPMLVLQHGEWVRGRLLSVPTAAYATLVSRLDALEGFNPARPADSAYRRMAQEVVAEDGRLVQAWVYVGEQRFVTGKPLIPEGDWPAYARRNQTKIKAWWTAVDTVSGLHPPSQPDTPSSPQNHTPS